MSTLLPDFAEMARALRAGKVSSRELTGDCLARIKRHDSSLNSFISVYPEQALAAADAADKAIAAGSAGPLTGIPMAHKDIFCAEGTRTTVGSKMLDNFVAPYDSRVVSGLAAAGMVSVGKTNMDEFAMGSSNETSYFGPVKNPWDLQRSPGGSSGGSAAAVAAGLVPAATGTDTGGSIRQPAALTGLTGLKPTYGRVSRYGMVAFASSLDQAGTLTRSASDAALMLGAMAGFDDRDSTCANVPVPDYSATLNDSLQGKTIGVPKEFFDDGLEAGCAQAVQDSIKEYQKLGAVIKEVSLPNLAMSVPVYYIVAPAECSSNLSRFDGVRFGYRTESTGDLADMYTRTRSEAFGVEVKRRIMTGAYVLSAGYYDAYYLQAQKVRQLISDDLSRCFAEVDVIMGPTTPTPAFKLGEKMNDPVQMYLNDIYTIAANLAGLPAISIPCGFSQNLPVGLQLIGTQFAEGLLLNCAHQYQQATDWHLRTPSISGGVA
ncbi:MAG: Asp-tRNA(Asn)/Glu-tRNA(Gln) amidotransferase subunit GatA [Chromatiales bacterium]|nr:Asp-tRNA(Asn)/Glu-tRNA(Gln) amidotransferase subunit GatA [Chromatiales bacterium]